MILVFIALNYTIYLDLLKMFFIFSMGNPLLGESIGNIYIYIYIYRHIFAGSLCKSMCIYRNRSNGCPMLLSMLSKQHEMTDHIYRAGSAAPLQSQRSGGILARVFTHRGRFLQHYLAQGFYGGNFINVPLSLGAD